jgi:hypothetical protein
VLYLQAVPPHNALLDFSPPSAATHWEVFFAYSI